MTATPASHTTTLRAEGFSCPSCVSKIEGALNKLAGVSNAKVSFANSKITVEHDPAVISVNDLVGAVKKAGYVAKPSAF